MALTFIKPLDSSGLKKSYQAKCPWNHGWVGTNLSKGLIEEVDELRYNEQDLVDDPEDVFCRQLAGAEAVFQKAWVRVQN